MAQRFLVPGSCAALVIALAAGSAHATLFSFASDVNSNGYTFAGTAGSNGSFNITDFSRPNTFNLLIDDDNGPNPTISIPVEFRANLTANTGTSTQIVGNLWQHSYRVSGSFGFYDTMGNALLTVNIDSAAPALFTVPGTQNAWSSTGAVLGADSFANITYTATSRLVTAMGGAATAANYGITLDTSGSGSSIGPDDFGFDLTALNGGAIGLAVALDPTTRLPTAAWRSESSFSGSVAGVIPTPASASLLALGALMSLRRRK